MKNDMVISMKLPGVQSELKETFQYKSTYASLFAFDLLYNITFHFLSWEVEMTSDPDCSRISSNYHGMKGLYKYSPCMN